MDTHHEHRRKDAHLFQRVGLQRNKLCRIISFVPLIIFQKRKKFRS